MDAIAFWLPLVWAAIIGVAVALYVILDGFDLGLGILFQFEPKENCRDLMMNSVAPFWDGNETWLVLGGAGLLVAFPLAYAVIMPGLYLPIIIMLLGLVFRGVAFEFRWAAKPSHEFWDNAFSWGSIVATFMQGVVLGGYLQGIEVKDKAFAGGSLDWFAPFPLFTGVALLGGYALLGATWLVMKIDGPLAAGRARLGKEAPACGARHHGHHQRVDAARLRAHRRPLVRLAEHPLPLAGADRDRDPRVGVLARIEHGPRGGAVPLRASGCFCWALSGSRSRTCRIWCRRRSRSGRPRPCPSRRSSCSSACSSCCR